MGLASELPRRHPAAGLPAWPVAQVFTLSLALAAARAEDPGRLTPDRCLLALAVGSAVAAWSAGLRPAAAVGIVAWLFDDGFVTSHAGVLHWATATDAPTLALLVACSVGAALLGRRLRTRAALHPTDAAAVSTLRTSRG